ncbi:MAG: phosphoribosylformylglycinamidine synthase [bacterium]|nr:phosphoribosylformylglycinamidine synthase [bacterium]
MIRIAIIQFPGVNSEYETARSVESVGAQADIIRFNAPADTFKQYAGFILPGGFAYEDRVRAGAIAAKDDVMGYVSEAVAVGKPVLGICNGAQVLVESGLVPGKTPGKVEMALAENIRPHHEGFYGKWIFMHARDDGAVLPMPMDHGEGRFTSEPEVVADAVTNGLVKYTYSDKDGGTEGDYNPNGSDADIAALGSYDGLALATMPHPERANWLFQVPVDIPGDWGERRRDAAPDDLYGPGPGRVTFEEFVKLTKD